MNKLNDIELTGLLCKIKGFNGHIERQHRDGLESALFFSLMEIERLARKAQARLNELKYGKDYQPPVEMMGQ